MFMMSDFLGVYFWFSSFRNLQSCSNCSNRRVSSPSSIYDGRCEPSFVCPFHRLLGWRADLALRPSRPTSEELPS